MSHNTRNPTLLSLRCNGTLAYTSGPKTENLLEYCREGEVVPHNVCMLHRIAFNPVSTRFLLQAMLEQILPDYPIMESGPMHYACVALRMCDPYMIQKVWLDLLLVEPQILRLWRKQIHPHFRKGFHPYLKTMLIALSDTAHRMDNAYHILKTWLARVWAPFTLSNPLYIQHVRHQNSMAHAVQQYMSSTGLSDSEGSDAEDEMERELASVPTAPLPPGVRASDGKLARYQHKPLPTLEEFLRTPQKMANRVTPRYYNILRIEHSSRCILKKTNAAPRRKGEEKYRASQKIKKEYGEVDRLLDDPVYRDSLPKVDEQGRPIRYFQPSRELCREMRWSTGYDPRAYIHALESSGETLERGKRPRVSGPPRQFRPGGTRGDTLMTLLDD